MLSTVSRCFHPFQYLHGAKGWVEAVENVIASERVAGGGSSVQVGDAASPSAARLLRVRLAAELLAADAILWIRVGDLEGLLTHVAVGILKLLQAQAGSLSASGRHGGSQGKHEPKRRRER